MVRRKILSIVVISVVIIAIFIGSIIRSALRTGYYDNDYVALAVYALCFIIVLINIVLRFNKKKS